ncbi:Protein FAR1-RELATED SEQUENCE 6 [Glycine soja]
MYMDEDQWTYDNTMSQEVDMDYENEQECGVNEPPHVDCSDAFNTSQVFGTRDDILQWARSIAHENGFVAIITRKKEFVRRDTGSKKCGCPFKLRGKPVHGGEGWMVKLICGIHNHELAKSLVGHPYVRRLTKDENNIIADMTKSMVKPRNILLTLKEHNANSCTTIKQIYNERSAYCSSIRGSDIKMQHLVKLLERDQYIYWHRLKDEVVVRDLFWCHPDVMKLCNACHLVFFIDSTCKTNRYRLPLLDFVGMTPTGMTFSAWFAYLEGERVNNFVWTLEQFRGLFLRRNRLPVVIVIDRDLALMNAVKTVFPKNAWEYALNKIAAEFERVHYAGNNPSSCGCVMRTTHGLPCACELSRYVVGSIPLDSIHMFWRRHSFSDQGLSEVEVSIKEEMETISKRFEEFDVGGKVTLKSELREIAYPDQKSMCPPPSKVNTKDAPKKSMNRSQRSTKRDPSYWKYVDDFHSVQNNNYSVKHSASSSNPPKPPKPTRIISMLDQFESFIQGFIHDVVDVKADSNCGYRSIYGKDSWSLVRNELIKELGKWSHDYINLFSGTERFEELRLSLLVDGFSKVSVNKWMDITEMGYVIASWYNVILVSLSRQQSMTFFPLRSQSPPDSFVHRMICVSHQYSSFKKLKRDYVDQNED